MKKLMILASAAVFGLSLHAANVNWGVDLDDDAYDGTHTFMFASGTQLSTLVGYLEAGNTTDFATEIGKITNKQVYEFQSDDWGAMAGSLKNMSAGDTVYAICYQTDLATNSEFLYSDPLSVTADYLYEAGGKPGKTFTFDGDSFTSSTIADVPEPTSGLLLLLGVAGLALRRRRA